MLCLSPWIAFVWFTILDIISYSGITQLLTESTGAPRGVTGEGGQRFRHLALIIRVVGLVDLFGPGRSVEWRAPLRRWALFRIVRIEPGT